MPISFLSISTFKNEVKNLCKKEKNGYHFCKQDICNKFKYMSFDDIWEMATRMRESGDVRLIKVRIPNSILNLSASDGFRVIMCCNKTIMLVAFAISN